MMYLTDRHTDIQFSFKFPTRLLGTSHAISLLDVNIFSASSIECWYLPQSAIIGNFVC